MVNFVKNIFLFILLLLLAKGALAQQEGRIRGRLIDTVGHETLTGALITVAGISDSTFIKRSLSKEDASFEVRRLPYGKYSVQITFQGFEPVLRVVHLNREDPLVDLGTLYLPIQVRELDSVRVQEPPMIMKKDTLAYNASRWQTQPYAPLADLLAKLPGVKVNNDGSMTVNGQPVDRILVDGKPFFNGDAKMALEHLPADLIRQIQVYQTTNEQSLRSGIASGSPGNKTINLVLKINRRTGEFGKAGAGAGTDGAYAAVLDLHHMNGRQQLSIAGDAGNADGLNTGKPTGGTAMSGRTAYGINRRWNGGINYRDTWNERTDVNGSFMNSRLHGQDARQMHTLNIFPGDSSTILNRQTNNITENSRQQLNFTVEHKLNASNSLTLRPTMQLQHTENRLWGQSEQRAGRSDEVIYRSSENSTGTSNSKTASADLLFLHRGKLPGQSFSAGLSTYGNHSRSNYFNLTQTEYAVPAAASRIFNQHVVNANSFFSLSPSFTYTLPIANRDALVMQTNFLYNSSNSRNEVFRFNETTHAFDQPDPSQSNDFTTIYNTATAMASYRFQRRRYTLVLGAGIESDQLSGKNESDNSTIKKRVTSFLPAADLVIRHDNGKSMQVGYNGKPVPLSVSQLQPVTTTSDSLFIQEGNPALKQPFTHSFTFTYSSLKTGSQQFFNVMVSGSTTVNAIQNSVSLLSNGAQVFKPLNMNGAASVYANANYTFPLTRQRSNISLTGNVRYARDPVLINGQKSDTRIINLSGEVSWRFLAGKGLTIDFNAASAYNTVHYSQDVDQRNNYFTETLSGRLGYTVRDYSFSLTEFYCWNNNVATAYQPKAPVLSLAASRRLFKRKEAEIIFSITDLLNQQTGAERTVTPNSMTDLQGRTRGRYAMLSFIYNVSRFKKGK